MVAKQIKSRKRVADHGEVFTAEREVNAMLDLVKDETNVESKFLEPACGEGNFLAEILRRKLAEVKRKYKKSPFDYEIKAVIAATTIYGVDILVDNVLACRERMFSIWDKEYIDVCKKDVNEDCRKTVKFILSRNIVCGNALTLKTVDENGRDTKEPIVFSEWAFVTGFNLQRSDYTFDKLMEGIEQGKDIFGNEKNSEKNIEAKQLSFIEESENNKEKLNGEGEFLKKYIAHYRKVWKDG